MFAIVDVEATGGNPKKDRITEIAIFVHNGERIIEQYCTLVNPNQYISPFITALTGISNEMVAKAPTWEEVAPEVVRLTEGRVLVAHNVRFDYSFIKNEFKRMGLRFQRKQLCTVRLSNVLLPNLQSYSLGRLCDKVGIPIEHRHRAFGDGAATAELFHLLIKKDRGIINDVLKDEICHNILPPNLTREQIDELPDETGVYYFRDVRDKIIYIGKSTNIRQRVISHFSSDVSSEKHRGLKEKVHNITYEITGNELVALLLESHEIKRWMPIFNSAQRRKKYRFGIYQSVDSEGYITLSTRLLRHEHEALIKVGSKRTAEGILRSIADKYSLCLQKCGLEETQAPCMHNRLNKCKGACTGEEDVLRYNRKVEHALSKYRYDHSDFVVLGEGRRPEERSVICVENGQLLGYTFIDDPEQKGHDFEEIKNLLNPLPDHPDLHSILRSYVKRKRKGHEVVYRNVTA